MSTLRSVFLCSAAALTVCSTASFGQDQSGEAISPNGTDEIIVTARKQNESLLKVPVTVSAVSSKDLARNNITDGTSLNTQVSSISFDKTIVGGSLTVRGIGSSTLDNGTEQSVTSVYDGLQTSRGIFFAIGFLDLAQVEVLKGPQALFFGRNSPGGVVSLTSQGPTSSLEGYVRAGYEFRADEKRIEAALSGPLTETLRARVALGWSDMGGWLRNTAQPAANPFYFGLPGTSPTIGGAPYRRNSSNNLTGRLTIDYRPESDFSATLRIGGYRSRDRGPAANNETVNCGGANRADSLGVIDPFSDCVLNNRVSMGPTPPELVNSGQTAVNSQIRTSPFGHISAYMSGLTMNYSGAAVDITSVTGYLGYDYKRQLNTPTIYAYGVIAVDEDFSQFSQEIRAVTHYDSPINLSAGLYFEDSKNSYITPNILFPTAPDPTTGSFINYVYNANSRSRSYSAFGQLRWKLLDQLEFDAGIRYTHDVRKGAVSNAFLNTQVALPLSPQGLVIANTKKYDNFSPELTLSWTPVSDSLIYGSYKGGYKAGGAASPQIVTLGFDPDTSLFFSPEKIKGFELGGKTALLDGRLRMTAAFYTYKYSNLQISNFDTAHFTIQPLGAGLRTKGFDFDTTYSPVHGLTLRGGLGYTRARYTRFVGIACYTGQTAATGCFIDPVSGAPVQDLSGRIKYRAPAWTGNLGASYDIHVGGNLMLGINGNMHFSSRYFTQENNSPYAVQRSYQIYDAGISLATEDDRWKLALIGTNLTDKQYVMSSLDQPAALQPGTIEGVISRPRQIMIQATMRY